MTLDLRKLSDTGRALHRMAASIRECGSGASLLALDASWLEQAEALMLETIQYVWKQDLTQENVSRYRAEIRELDAQIECISRRKESLEVAIGAAERSSAGLAGGSRSKRRTGSSRPRDVATNPRGDRARPAV